MTKYHNLYNPEKLKEVTDKANELKERFGDKYLNELGKRAFAIGRKVNGEVLNIACDIILDIYRDWITLKKNRQT